MNQIKDKLSRRVILSSIWIFILRTSIRIVDVLKLIILARLLEPKDFGLLGIGLLSVSILETFSQTGFDSALIQKKENIIQYLNTAWTIQIIRGIFLFSILYFCAPLIAQFFKAPETLNIIKILAFTQLFYGLRNIGVVFFKKELQYKKEFIISFIPILTGAMIAIVYAVIYKNVWALVYGVLTRYGVGFVLTYIVNPFRPKIQFDIKKIKELAGFGKWVMGSSAIVFIVTHGEAIFVGKFLGTVMLGFYQMAYRLANLVPVEIAQVIVNVTFPAYSKMQDNIARLSESFIRVLTGINFVTFPIVGLVFVLAADFTEIFLGEKWLLIVVPMQILVFASLFRVLAMTTSSLVYAVGKPKIWTKWQAIQLVIMVVLIYPFSVKWGLKGVSLVLLISSFISAIGLVCETVRILNVKFGEYYKMTFYPLINACIMSIIIYVIKDMLNKSDLVGFICSGIAGVIVYGAMTFVMDKYFNYGINVYIKNTLISLNRKKAS
ncbi:lipopolysaccharide biosynthesis protein [Elusimicrobiota bacterium]